MFSILLVFYYRKMNFLIDSVILQAVLQCIICDLLILCIQLREGAFV